MRLLRKAAVAAVAVAALTPAAADAAPALDGTFTPTGTPTYLAPGSDGSVWFSNTGSTSEIAEISPSGAITEYSTPGDRQIVGITAGPDVAGGPNNRIWATYEGGVIKWDPATNTGTDFPIALLNAPRDIAPDKDGNLWAVAGDHLVKIAPNGTKIDDIPAVAGRDIVLGSDNRMWVADFGYSAITAVGTAAPYPKQSFPTSVAPQGIAAGPAGQLGIALPNNKMGRITTAGAITETTDNGTDAFGTAYGADGAYWFAQFASNTVGRLTPAGQYSRAITLPAASGPRHITAGPNKTLWVSGETSKKIYRITGVEAPKPTTPPPPPPPPPGGDKVAPAFSAAKVNVSKRRFTFTLSEAATLRLQVDQRLRGQRRGGKCRKPRRGAKRTCNYWKKRRTLTVQGKAGQNIVSLGRKLRPGKYRLVARATDAAGNKSKRTIAFKVKAKKRKRS